MKRILICGANGLLGQRLALTLSTETEYEVLNTSHHRAFVFDHSAFGGLDYTQLDITRKGDVKSLVRSFQPTVIINAAGATNVDWCESNREETWKVNVTSVENLADAARSVGAKLIHISTDYVFDGKSGPYKEDDMPNPISYYGKSKLAGENAVRVAGIPHAIIRTIVVYGRIIGQKRNFALWVINSLKSGEAIRCADDQVSNPTYVGSLACAIKRTFELDRAGLYHVCGAEHINRYDFAVRIAEVFKLDASMIHRVKTADLHQVAPRPMVTGFVTTKAEKELQWKPMTITEGLLDMKHESERTN